MAPTGFFAEQVCLDADAAACGEILYGIIRELTAVTPDIAMLLYVAIATDTGCFVYSNTTAQTHRIASELLGCGIDVGPVNKALFRTKSRTRLAMEARMVADMTLFDQDRVVVMTIPCPCGRRCTPRRQTSRSLVLLRRWWRARTAA